jgi:predicted proteasome-type protease
VVKDGYSGALDEDLPTAVRRALELSRDDCRKAALERTWEQAIHQFMSHLARVDGAGALFDEALLI